jgi:hypothetical protein
MWTAKGFGGRSLTLGRLIEHYEAIR